ncbi:MAG: dolichyl-phosphate-mannose--protein mannosyltransferase [Actinomycetota bacterium]
MSTVLQRLNRPVIAVLAVTAIAGVLRFTHLSRPPELFFDENYYAKSGCILIGDTDQVCRVDNNDERYWRDNKWDVGSWVHPPLGKWMIGMGEKVFGVTPFGWRFSSALAGTLIVTLVATVAQLLFGSAIWTFVAGLLLAVEDLNVVLSRSALLDIHLELWVVVGFLLLLLDRRWIDRRSPPDPESEPEPEPPGTPEDPDEPERVVPGRARSTLAFPLWRPWRFAAGIALGAAFSVKWSGAMAILGALILSVAWETTRRHRKDVSLGRALARAVRQESLGLVIAFVVVPLAVYLIVYLPWFNHFGWSLKDWWENQTAMLSYHRGLKTTALDTATNTYTPTHPYYSRAWTWLFMLRPVNFYSRDVGRDIAQVLAVGNPAIFWASLWAVPFVALMWRRRGDWRAGFIVASMLAQYLPWFLITRPQFFFYVAPITPFMVLAIAYVIRDLAGATIVLREPDGGTVESSRHPYLPFVWGYVLLAVGLFLWFWPVLTANPISRTMWQTRVWFHGWV